MRNKFADCFHLLAKKDDRLVCVVADISPAGSMEKFRKEFPKRFINVGVSEQIMIGMCAGFAQEGLKPFAYTIGTFALYRPFEFIRDDLAYQNLPVTVVGIGGGLTYSTLGATHHMMEDISIAWSIPNLSVVAPCDPLEVMYLTEHCVNREEGGPIYMRLAKAGEPNLTERSPHPVIFGKLRPVLSGNSDIAIISYGAIMKLAKEVANETGASLYSCHTLQPLDIQGIKEVLKHYSEIIVIEEMLEDVGLGTRIKSIAYDNGYVCDITNYGLKKKFMHVYGSHDDLLNAHGLTLVDILETR